jgi:diguanylate cyclase (GGDEF)-like protein
MATVRLSHALTVAVGVRDWAIWSVREPLRTYLFAVPLAVIVVFSWAITRLHWQVQQLVPFVGLVACGIIAVELTRRVREIHGALSRDLQTVWYLAIATALPPCYAFAAPIPLTVYKLWRMPRSAVHRRIFSNATLSLAYGMASLVFHAIPRTAAGLSLGTGFHVITWVACVGGAGMVGWLINHILLLGAIKLSDPAARIRELLGTRESITTDLAELNLAVLVAVLVAINPVLMALALPPVVLYRRYLMQAQLVAHARLDAKTGLLNAGTWQREAEAELIRAARARVPLALIVLDVDHFNSVKDTAGREAGDQVLRDIATTLTESLRGFGLVGRVGGEEFAILLPQTGVADAKRIGERIRDHISGEPIAIEDGSHAGFVFRLTVSIGIAVLDHSKRALAELMGSAEVALSEAKSTGRNRVCVIPGSVAEG